MAFFISSRMGVTGAAIPKQTLSYQPCKIFDAQIAVILFTFSQEGLNFFKCDR
ncbi:hypothetical protein IQ275_13790 [Nostoc sp. LEGE 12450]|nr:hypothetical protein [Nostoc sp. LEGE 12450]MBE8988234.1 hypothetical protein [Nostoc sp. LEGE 12450]